MTPARRRALILDALSKWHLIAHEPLNGALVLVHRRPVAMAERLASEGTIVSLNDEYDLTRRRDGYPYPFQTKRSYDRARFSRDRFEGGMAGALQYELSREWLDDHIDPSQSLIYWAADNDPSGGEARYGGSERVTVGLRAPEPCVHACGCESTCTPGDSLFEYLISPTRDEIVRCVENGELPEIEVDRNRMADEVMTACLVSTQLKFMAARDPEFDANAVDGIVVRDDVACGIPWFRRYAEVQTAELPVDENVLKVTVNTAIPEWMVAGGLPRTWTPRTYEEVKAMVLSARPGESLEDVANSIPVAYTFASEAVRRAERSVGPLMNEHLTGILLLVRCAHIVSDLQERCNGLGVAFEIRR